jgi:hypothetical protein
VSTSSSLSDQSIALRRSLDARAAHLGLQEMTLEVHEAALAEELERGLRRPDGCDLPVELDEVCTWVRRVVDDQAAEADHLLRQLAWVAKVLIYLGLPPIEDIPRLPQMAQDALPMVALVVEHLQEALDFDASTWG